MDYVVVLPSLDVCEARAAARPEGRIEDYARYRDFYSMFGAVPIHVVSDGMADASITAKLIQEGLTAGKFAVA